MVKNINPFVVSGKIPAAYFCDRIEESAQLEKSLGNQLNVVLTSPRRMGKTSLIDFTFDKTSIKNEYICISVLRPVAEPLAEPKGCSRIKKKSSRSTK